MSRRYWTDKEVKGLACRNAGSARSALGSWLATDPDEQTIEWLPDKWRDRVDVNTLPARLVDDREIRRRDLFDLAERALSSCSDRTVTALLIGVVAWGSGSGLRRNGIADGDARGPWRAQQALNVPSQGEAITRIRCALEITRREGGSAAYAALSYGGRAKLTAMGESFFSKLIYACGYRSTTTPPPGPLILDTNVRKALVRRGGILEGEDWTLYYTPQGYRQYLLIAQTWADLWNVRSDQVEFALFQYGKSLS